MASCHLNVIRLPAMPYPTNVGQEKRFWTTGNEPHKQGEYGWENYHCRLAVRFSCSPVRSRGGAAGGESPTDRLPKFCLPLRYLGPHRGVPAGSARVWVRRGKEPCH